MISDSEIISRIRKGDKGEFESLFRSFYVSLVRYARIILKDHYTSEEIVQSLFFRLWQDRKNIKVESSLSGYLFRAVHNRCLHWIEHNRIIEKHAQEMVYRHTGSVETPSEIMQYKELQAKIVMILEKLPERCGKVFCMNRFDGLKYAEIADKLSVSVKTVEADMGRALREFRIALKEQ